jgi:hypothetical protein
MKAHCRVVGLGLGFWSYSKDTFKSRQTKFYLDTFDECVYPSTPTLAVLCPCVRATAVEGRPLIHVLATSVCIRLRRRDHRRLFLMDVRLPSWCCLTFPAWNSYTWMAPTIVGGHATANSSPQKMGIACRYTSHKTSQPLRCRAPRVKGLQTPSCWWPCMRGTQILTQGTSTCNLSAAAESSTVHNQICMPCD